MIDKTKPPPGWYQLDDEHEGKWCSDEWWRVSLDKAHCISEQNAAPYVDEERARIVAWLRERAASYRDGEWATPESVTLDAAAEAIDRGEVK